MKIIDAHVHLYPEPIIEKECTVSEEPVNDLLMNLSKKITKNNISQAVVYILDEKILSQDITIPKNLIVSTTVGIQKNYQLDIKKASYKNIKILKILPYDQKIFRKQYPKIRELAQLAKDQKMVLSICSTYGSKMIYDTNGVELATYIKKSVDLPIILAHGGGPKIFDAMSISLDYEDVFLDLSFSLKYWWNSSVIKDYAFAVKKLEGSRCFYGSDYPYVSFKESMSYFLKFITKYDISDEDKKQILTNNFEEFKKRYL